MKKVVSILMMAAMLLTMVPVFAEVADVALAISSPTEGAVLDSSNTITVRGTVPTGTASILIDGVPVAENVTASGGAFSQTFDTSSCEYGVHKITLTSGDKSVDRYVHFTSPAVSELRGTNYTGDSGATSSNQGGWGCSFASNLTVNDSTSGFTITQNFNGDSTRIGRTYEKHASGYIRVAMNNNRTSESMNTGVVRVDADIAVNDTTPGLQFGVRDRKAANDYWGGSKYYISDNLVGQDETTGDNIFMDGTPFVSGQSYHVTVLVDVDRKTRTYLIDGKPILEDERLTREDVLESVDMFYFELTSGTSNQAKLTVNNLNLTTIERYPFITGVSGSDSFSEQTAAYLYHVEIPGESDTAYISLSNAVASETVTAGNIILTANGTAVDADVSADGNVIAVTPTNGFVPGAAYQLEMTGLRYDFSENNVSHQMVYPKKLRINFDVSIAISSPTEGAVLDSSNTITVRGTVPAGTVSILIDGVPVAENVTVSGGTFSQALDTSSYEYGVHKITLTSGDKSVDRYVHFTSPAVSELRGTNYTGGSGATSSNMGGWGCSFASNLTVNDSTNGFTITQNFNGDSTRIGRTYEKHASGYIRVAMNNNRTSESMNTGVVRVDADIAVNDTTPGLQFGVRDRKAANDYWGGSKYYILDSLVGQDEANGSNIFMDGTPFVSGQSYHVTVLVDVDRKTRTYLIDGKPILEDVKLTRTDVLESVDMFYFELPSGTSNQAKLTVNNLNLTTIERYPFVTGLSDSNVFSEQTAADLYHVEIPAESGTVYIRLSNAVASETVTSGNIILTANGTAVDADVSADGNVITVTPTNGFVPCTSYQLEMTGLRYDFSENNSGHKNVYPKALSVYFKTTAQDSIETISIVHSEGTVTASTTITKAAAENTVLPDEISFILAVYSGGKLIKAEPHTYALADSCATPLSETISNVSVGNSVKAFVWTVDCKPLVDDADIFVAAD